MDRRDKIGIMTFFRVNNYGAVLQAYGLSTTLQRIGYSVEIINYECEFLEKPYRLENLLKKGIISYLASMFGYFTRFPRNRKFKAFREQYLMISKKKYSKYKFKELPYDIIIAGSDQIWNMRATNGETAYLLAGVSKQILKYSYAASFGTSSVDARWNHVLVDCLADFRKITVREKAGQEIIKGLLSDTSCEIVIDPVFLISAEEWISISIKPKLTSYVLVYQQSITPKVVEIAKRIAEDKQLKMLYIPFPMGKISLGKCKTNYSPEEWLGLICNAEYVVTDSFHGVALSIILNKNFFVSLAGISLETGGRISELLTKFHLESRYIDKEFSEKNYEEKINYTFVNAEIEKEQRKSLDYLEGLGKEYAGQ